MFRIDSDSRSPFVSFGSKKIRIATIKVFENGHVIGKNSNLCALGRLRVDIATSCEMTTVCNLSNTDAFVLTTEKALIRHNSMFTGNTLYIPAAAVQLGQPSYKVTPSIDPWKPEVTKLTPTSSFPLYMRYTLNWLNTSKVTEKITACISDLQHTPFNSAETKALCEKITKLSVERAKTLEKSSKLSPVWFSKNMEKLVSTGKCTPVD